MYQMHLARLAVNILYSEHMDVLFSYSVTHWQTILCSIYVYTHMLPVRLGCTKSVGGICFRGLFAMLHLRVRATLRVVVFMGLLIAWNVYLYSDIVGQWRFRAVSSGNWRIHNPSRHPKLKAWNSTKDVLEEQKTWLQLLTRCSCIMLWFEDFLASWLDVAGGYQVPSLNFSRSWNGRMHVA